MPFEMIHFRDSDKIIRKKKLDRDVKATLEYVYDALQGSLYRGELLRQALDEMGWRENGSLNILDGRRYQYKGFKKGVALDGSFAAYEYILEGLFRLEIGFQKGKDRLRYPDADRCKEREIIPWNQSGSGHCRG